MKYASTLAIGVLLLGGLCHSALRAAEADAEKEPPTPMEVVKPSTERVLQILRDPELEGEKKQEKRREMVRKVVADHFDWRALAKRSLARHWRDRTEEEQEEFTALFRELLLRTYVSRIEKHADAEITYKDPEIEEGYASVMTVAKTREGQEAPIEYRLHKVDNPRLKEDEEKDGQVEGDEEKEPKKVWLIYDVRVEGVSLVNNYRSQFNDIVIGRSYETLVKRLRKKVGADD